MVTGKRVTAKLMERIVRRLRSLQRLVKAQLLPGPVALPLQEKRLYVDELMSVSQLGGLLRRPLLDLARWRC